MGIYGNIKGSYGYSIDSNIFHQDVLKDDSKDSDFRCLNHHFCCRTSGRGGYMGMGQNPGTPSEHQNSWDLWMFIPLKKVLIGIDPYPYSFNFHWKAP